MYLCKRPCLRKKFIYLLRVVFLLLFRISHIVPAELDRFREPRV